jgi:hypothetical protein
MSQKMTKRGKLPDTLFPEVTNQLIMPKMYCLEVLQVDPVLLSGEETPNQTAQVRVSFLNIQILLSFS